MLSARNLAVSIGRIRILRDISFEVSSGQIVGLIGRNGAGKTTLMRTIMGLLPAQEGTLSLDGKDLGSLAAHKRAALAIGYMPEDRRLVPQFTVDENILLPMWATRGAGAMQRLAWIRELMPEVARFSGRKAVTLSGGQQKLVSLARALMCGQKLLLLDEPFEGVAPVLAQRLSELIDDLHSEGIAVLLSESDYMYSAHLLDRLYVIERGALEERAPRTQEPAMTVAAVTKRK